MRRAQRFSVNVYEDEYRRLADRGALYPVDETGIMALREQFYGKATGITADPSEMEPLHMGQEVRG